MSKSETNFKFEISKQEQHRRAPASRHFFFGIRHCFGFRDSIFGFPVGYSPFGFIILCLLILSGCNRNSTNGPVNRNLPTTTMQIGSESFTLEIAADDRTREVGLMNRKSMPANHGMIFVFPGERRLAFWMRHTHIPLDIIYLDREGKVVSIHQMKPLDVTSVPSAGPAKYAIELNRGTAVRVGVKAGDRLEIPPESARTDD